MLLPGMHHCPTFLCADHLGFDVMSARLPLHPTKCHGALQSIQPPDYIANMPICHQMKQLWPWQRWQRCASTAFAMTAPVQVILRHILKSLPRSRAGNRQRFLTASAQTRS